MAFAEPFESLVDLEETVLDVIIAPDEADCRLQMLPEMGLQAVAITDVGGENLRFQVVQCVVIHGIPDATVYNLGMWPEVSANCNR
jgi:hypothetical protein